MLLTNKRGRDVVKHLADCHEYVFNHGNSSFKLCKVHLVVVNGTESCTFNLGPQFFCGLVIFSYHAAYKIYL